MRTNVWSIPLNKEIWRMTLEPHWKRKAPSVMCQNNTQSYVKQLAQINTVVLVKWVKWAYRHDLTCVEKGIQSTKQTLKVVIHVEMPKAAPKKSICHFQKLEMILKWNKQNTVRLSQKYQFVLIKHKINC